MAEYKVTKVSDQIRTWSKGANGPIYYHTVNVEGRDRPISVGKKAPNSIEVGQILNGTIEDKPTFSEDGFRAEKPAFNPTAAKSFQADPKKLKQELTLEVGRNLSIQRQVAVKGVVDLIIAGVRSYEQRELTYNDLMELLNPEQVKDIELPDPDLPPVELYDESTHGQAFSTAEAPTVESQDIPF